MLKSDLTKKRREKINFPKLLCKERSEDNEIYEKQNTLTTTRSNSV